MVRERHPGWEDCPGSGWPPYRYIKGKEKCVVNSETGRVVYARAICELCDHEHSVNVKGVLRTHKRLRRTNPVGYNASPNRDVPGQQEER